MQTATVFMKPATSRSKTIGLAFLKGFKILGYEVKVLTNTFQEDEMSDVAAGYGWAGKNILQLYEKAAKEYLTNEAKFAALKAWAEQNGAAFYVFTEHVLERLLGRFWHENK